MNYKQKLSILICFTSLLTAIYSHAESGTGDETLISDPAPHQKVPGPKETEREVALPVPYFIEVRVDILDDKGTTIQLDRTTEDLKKLGLSDLEKTIKKCIEWSLKSDKSVKESITFKFLNKPGKKARFKDLRGESGSTSAVVCLRKILDFRESKESMTKK